MKSQQNFLDDGGINFLWWDYTCASRFTKFTSLENICDDHHILPKRLNVIIVIKVGRKIKLCFSPHRHEVRSAILLPIQSSNVLVLGSRDDATSISFWDTRNHLIMDTHNFIKCAPFARLTKVAEHNITKHFWIVCRTTNVDISQRLFNLSPRHTRTWTH